MDIYGHYKQYGGTDDFGTAVGFSIGSAVGSLAGGAGAAALIGAFIPGPGWAVAGSILVGTGISYAVSYAKKRTIGY